MAAATFDDVLNAQRETNEILRKQRNPLDGRTGAGKALLDAQKATTSALFSVVDSVDAVSEGVANPPKPDKSSASADEETKKDEQSFLSKTFGKLGSKIEDGFKSLKGVLGKFKDTAMGGLKAFLIAAGLFALIKFLESKTWKKIRDFIKDNPMKGVMLALAAIAAFFAPITTFKIVRTLTGNIVLYVKNISKFLRAFGNLLLKGILAPIKLLGKFAKVVAVSLEGYGKLFKNINAGFAKARTGLTTFSKWVKSVPAAFKAWTETGGKIAKIVGSVAERIGKIFGWIKNTASKFGSMLGGVSRFAGPLGLIISLGTSIFASFTAFRERFAETGSILESIETAVSTFIGTFIGVIPDLIKDGISWVLRKMGEVFGIEAFTDGADVLDSFSFADLITEGLELFIDAVKSLFGDVSFLAKKFLAALGFGDAPEEPEEEKRKKEKQIKKDERVSELIKEKGLTSGEAHQIARAEQAAESGGVKRPMDDAAQLEKSIAHMKETLRLSAPSVKRRFRSAKQTKEEESIATMQDRKHIAEQIALLEHRKAELEASRTSGNVTNIAQNNSSNVSAPTTRQESIVVTDSDMMGVVAAGPA